MDIFELQITEEQNGTRLDSFLAKELEGISRSYVSRIEKKAIEKIRAEFEKMLGKDLKSSTHQEILDAWKNASDESKNKVYAEFKNPDNSFTKKARIHNNLFNFVSTFLMVPAFKQESVYSFLLKQSLSRA